MSEVVAVIDYGMGNLHSAGKALEKVANGQQILITGDADQIRAADRVVPGGCNLCFNCCTTKFHFKGDQLVKVTGNEDDPMLGGRVCPKSQLTLQLHTSPERATRPLKRVGERGQGRFEPISWDQALDEIAARLSRLREAHGPETLGIFSGTRTGTLTNRHPTLSAPRVVAE